MTRVTLLALTMMVALAIAGCGAAASTPAASPAASAVTSPSPDPTPTATSLADPSPSPDRTSGSIVIPDGWLTVDDGAPLVAPHGTSCWTGPSSAICIDSVWQVPETGGSAPPDATCVVRIADGTPMTAWSIAVLRAAAPDFAEAEIVAERDLGSPQPEVRFTCPGTGDWAIRASLRGAPGDVSYTWRLLVG